MLAYRLWERSFVNAKKKYSNSAPEFVYLNPSEHSFVGYILHFALLWIQNVVGYPV